MTIEVATPLYAYIDNALKVAMSSGITNVMLGLGGLIGTFWLLNFTLRSIKWLVSGLDSTAQEIITEIGKMAFICSMAFNVPWYLSTIVPFVTGAPSWMGGLMSNLDGSQVNQIDAMVDTFMTTFLEILKAMKFSIWDIDFAAILNGWFSLVFFGLGGGLFLLACISTLIVTKVATTILLSLGPVFIAFALFDQTRQWFWGWVSQLAGFMLTQVMFAIVLALEIGFVHANVLNEGKLDPSLTGAFTMSLFFLVLLLLVVELPGYAASIMGGSPVGGGMGGLAGKATGLRTAQSVAGMLRNKLSGKNKIS